MTQAERNERAKAAMDRISLNMVALHIRIEQLKYEQLQQAAEFINSGKMFKVSDRPPIA